MLKKGIDLTDICKIIVRQMKETENEKMTLGQFKKWYVEILEGLYPDRDAGFAILMIVFPLLERYLRGKLSLPLGESIGQKGKAELQKIFPELKTTQFAGEFWEVFRHGLLHQVTLFNENRNGANLPTSRITHDIPISIAIEADGSFTLQPVLFAKKVLELILSDFGIFMNEQKASIYPLPTVRERKVPSPRTQGYPISYKGTSNE